MNYMLYIVVAIVAVVLTKLLDQKSNTESYEVQSPKFTDYKDKYQAKLLLTKNEWYEYRKSNYFLFLKSCVRLLLFVGLALLLRRQLRTFSVLLPLTFIPCLMKEQILTC